MKLRFAVFVLCLLKASSCDNNILKLFDVINKNVVNLNAISAEMEWESPTNPHSTNTRNTFKVELYINKRTSWQRHICNKLSDLRNHLVLNNTQQRQAYLLCRGSAYKVDEVRSIYKLNERIKSIYNTIEICIPHIFHRSNEISNLTYLENTVIEYLSKRRMKLPYSHPKYVAEDHKICLKQKDIEELAACSRNEQVLKWIWLTWREKTGSRLRRFYPPLVILENKAARRNGYTDIGETWREELEILDVRRLCRRLYKSIRPLYTLLHGVVRYFLRIKYGEVVPERGPIPSHLLGNLWMQNWDSLADIIIPNTIDLDATMKIKNWDVYHLVKRAEDFYMSLNLPAMTDIFWRKSVFTDGGNNDVQCQGTAADMFKNDDYRILYCSGVSLQDFNVLHHEMGHIQYYMAYKNQPGIFRQANSALHESIGEAIMLGVVTPQHLNRLGLINDSLLYSMDEEANEETDQSVQNRMMKGSDDKIEPILDSAQKNMEGLLKNATTTEKLLLKRALNKLPQIPFTLLIDEYRWKYFEGSLNMELLNKEFWDMSLQLQGIAPPEERGEQFFDAGAVYHVADNTPYIRYYLSSFLQHQLFEHLCKVSIFGNQRAEEPLPKTMVPNNCDIYGAKAVGKLLKNLMSYGHSQNWREILKVTMGQDDISPEPLLRYYQPLYNLLTKLVRTYKIPVGW